jgi:PAS domain S-box-containing protein
MPRAVSQLDEGSAAVTRARHFARESVHAWHLEAVEVEVELVTSELVTNAVLHGRPPVSLELSLDAGVLRIAVGDCSAAPPVPGHPGSDAMTGRGLALVASLASAWGFLPASAGSPHHVTAGTGGKVVWADIAVGGEPAAATPDDVDALLERWGDPADTPGGEPRYTVELGDVPTDLLVAAKAHVDNVVRELTLASYDAAAAARADGEPRQLGGQLAQLLHDVVTGFAQARQAIKRQALAAQARGDERTTLTLTLPASMADAGEQYLAAMDDVDEFARAARLLTVESPPEHRAFRHWYVQSLVDQLRARARGEVPPPAPTFERFLLGEVASIAAAHRVSRRAARLQRVTAALAAAVSAAQVADVAVAECLSTLDALAGTVALVGAESPLVGDDAHWARPAVDEVLATGRPVWVEAPAGWDRWPGVTRDRGTAAMCAVPLAVAGDVIGVLALSFEVAQLFDADDRAFVEAVAAETAQTLTRTRLHDEQVHVAQRLRRLQTVAAELASRSDVGSVCEAAVRHAAAAVDAVITTILLATPDRSRLTMIEALGGDYGAPGWQREWSSFPVDADMPAAEVFRTGRPVIVGASQLDAFSGRFAPLPRINHPLACLPLKVDGTVAGVLTLSFRVGRDLSDADVGFLLALADVCAQALGRAHALDKANRVSARFAFLAEASRQLGGSLDYERTLQTVADLAVAGLADWCGIDLVDGGEITSVAVAHADPERVAFARRFRELYPVRPDQSTGMAAVIASGEPRVVNGITDDLLRAAAIDDQHLEMVREIGMAAVLMVPLRAGTRVVGGLTLIRTDPSRPFTAGDVDIADDLGRRAGTAVENARLFREVQASRNTDTGASHARLDLALAAASIGSFDWSFATGEVHWDARMCAIHGVDARDGVRPADGTPPFVVSDDRPAVETAVRRAIERIGDLRAEFRIRRPDGAVRWVECRGRVLAGDDGVASRMIGVAYDSTEVREARDRVVRTLEHMDDAFFSLDSAGRFTYVNSAAERLLGRDRAALLGRDARVVPPGEAGAFYDERFDAVLRDQQPVTFQRHLADTGREYAIRARPIPDGIGVYIADISSARQLEQERAELRAASSHALSQAETARGRLAFVAEASADITTTLDPVEVCRRLANHAVGRLADWVSIYLVEGGQANRVAAAHRDPQWGHAVARLVGDYPVDLRSGAMVARAFRERRPVVEQHMVSELVAETYPDRDARQLVDGMGVSSAFVAPMIAGPDVVGVMAFIRAEPGNEFEPDDVQLGMALAGRAALAVQNALLYARQTTVAQALQQAVLPEELPRIEGLQLQARYEPARGGAGIGGDFYDVFRLPSGLVALAVGDAAGHGLQSGALMGQLRNALRAYAVEGRGPAATLAALSDMIAALEPDAFATAFYAELEPRTGRFTWASAGHPPPLLLLPGEAPRYLDDAATPPLGVVAVRAEQDVAELVVPVGGAVLMYTDGLIERRRADLSDGLRALEQVAGRVAGVTFVDDVVREMRAMQVGVSVDDVGFADDVCVLLAVRGLST